MSNLNPSSLVKNLFSFIQNYEVAFSNSLLTLITVGCEQLFRVNAFYCPSTHDRAYNYALVFFVAPPIVLLVLGIAVNNLTWRICQGCCVRKGEAGFCSGSICSIFVSAIVAPCAWVFITFMDGNYYACMLATEPRNKQGEEYLLLMGESQNIAWISLAVSAVAFFLAFSLVRCGDSMTYERKKYLKAYRDAEERRMDASLQESAKLLAEENVADFMRNELKTVKDWDDVSKVPDVNVGKQERKVPPKKVFFTPLHEWTDKNKAGNINPV